jgi:hypothetical protein
LICCARERRGPGDTPTGRQLTDYQKVELAKPLEDLIAEKARLRKVEAGKTYGIGKNSFPSNEGNLDPIYTAKEVAKAIGVSKATYERAKRRD